MKASTSVTKDPICGMTVDEATALHAERDGKTFYFCSEHCLTKFISGDGNPESVAVHGDSGSGHEHHEHDHQKHGGEEHSCSHDEARNLTGVLLSAAHASWNGWRKTDEAVRAVGIEDGWKIKLPWGRGFRPQLELATALTQDSRRRLTRE